MENEKRLIDANAFREFWNKNYRHQYANDTFLFAIANFPTVDAVEVVHGRWIEGGKTMVDDVKGCVLHCSECHDYCYNFEPNPRHNYCPNCGAKMDGDGR